MKNERTMDIRAIEKKIGYTFNDRSLLIQSFTRTSYCNEVSGDGGERLQSNEVLEFFGDTVLSCAIITFLLNECTERYKYGIKTDLGEGDFSNIKSKLSDKQNLSRSMKALGLQKHLRVGEGDLKLGITDEPSVMEDLFESIIGAIYIDSGMSMDAVIRSVGTMLDISVYKSRDRAVQNAKNLLQEWCQDKSHRLPAPRYETLSEDGPDHKKTYQRGCYIGDRLVGRGFGKNFKLADTAAAEDALNALKAENVTVMSTEIDKTDSKKASTAIKEAPTIPTIKASHAKKESPTISKNDALPVDAGLLIKTYISQRKLKSPAYRDLGEITKNGKSSYRVECAFSGDSFVGIGETRSLARENANALLARSLGLGKSKNKGTNAKTKSAARSNIPKKRS